MFCARNLENFSEVLTHLCQDHQLPLNPRLDFCAPCGIIYSSRLEGLEHVFSHHILAYEDFQVTCEPKSHDEVTTLFLAGIFEQVKEIRKQIMSCLLFDKELPPHEDPEIDFDAPTN